MKEYEKLLRYCGRTLEELTSALSEIDLGSLERLKEFGIRALIKGDTVVFTFRGIKKQVLFTKKDIENYIKGLSDEVI